MTTQNDNPRYVKHILGSIYVFFILSGYSVRACVWHGSPKGLVRNLLMQSWTVGTSNIHVSKTYFVDIVTTQNDVVKHVLGSIYAFSILFGYWAQMWGGGGGLPRDWYATC